MRIKETKAGFTEVMDMGKFAFFLDVDDDGVSITSEDLVKQAQHFPRVVIFGKEPFKQRDSISKFIKLLYRKNPKMKFNIYTNGLIRPIGIVNFDVNYYVDVELKNSGIDYDKRINPGILSWFLENDAKFIFSVTNVDDFDEAELIVKDIGIPKAQVYFKPSDNLKINEKYEFMFRKVLKFCKVRGYNYTFNLRRML